jgi:shikimate kinase
LNHCFAEKSDVPVPVDLLVAGSVPAGSGLSSSAAMVVASTLAFLAVNGKVRIICIRWYDIEFTDRVPLVGKTFRCEYNGFSDP